MKRRTFARLCSGAALLPTGWPALAQAMRDYPRARLVDAVGAPIRAAAVPTEQALVFAYPYRATPCFLVNAGRAVDATADLNIPASGDYRSPMGVGPNRSLVAFVAICTHQLSYPMRGLSAIRYAANDSALAGAPRRIVCCAHGSVFDPCAGGRTVGGPAPHPLLPVRLEHDPDTDQLWATGTLGEEFLQRFFKAYKSDLIEDYGPGAYRQPVGPETPAILQSEYSRRVTGC